MPLLADHLYSSKIPKIGGGLLTTVDNLPALLKHQYPTSYKPKSAAIKRSILQIETPLDLTVKADAKPEFTSITPPSTPSPPPKKRYKFTADPPPYPDNGRATIIEDENRVEPTRQRNETVPKSNGQEKSILASKNNQSEQKQVTPQKPIQAKEDTELKMGKSVRPGKKQKRNKATRKLKFDEDTSSPVSGTIIRRLEEIEDEDQIGDIDPEYNIVEVTEEAKAEIAAIVNVIGDYVCKLCKRSFEDAFELARHRCSCIVLLEYRCPECGKRFNCPANLASHRRWHKPRPHGKGSASAKSSTTSSTATDKYSCTDCKKTFKRLAYLKKHQLTHQTSNQVVQPVHRIEDTHNSHSNASFYYNEELMRANEDEEEEEAVVVETYHPTKLQTFTQIVFRYASSMNGHSEGEDDNIVYSPLSRGSTPISMCSAPSPPPQLRTEDENLAAAALAALGRNGSSVIRHTTLSV